MSDPLKVDFLGLKRLGKDYLDALPTATLAESENGFKCLGLAYLGMVGSDLDMHQAALLMQIIGREKIKHEFVLYKSGPQMDLG